MSKRILVPLDGSDRSREALRFATKEWPDAEIALLHVINPAESTTGAGTESMGAPEQWFDSARERGKTLLEDAASELDRDVETFTEVGRPAHTILEVAEENGFDHIVLGSRGRTGVQRVLLGSVAEGVVRKAEVPVTVVR